jgi:hypothetical protein
VAQCKALKDDSLVGDDEWETGLFETLDAIDHADHDAYREVYQEFMY